jgi:hypothetical protein
MVQSLVGPSISTIALGGYIDSSSILADGATFFWPYFNDTLK